MNYKSIFSFFVCFLFTTTAISESLYQTLNANTIIDLTHPLHNEMVYWPGGVPFNKERLVDYKQGYRLHKFTMGENTGTHIDAASHFIKGGKSIDLMSLKDLVVPIGVIDIRRKAAAYPDYQLTAGDILLWESVNGKISEHSLVILNTGWHEKFDNPERYINRDSGGVMHFPGYSRGAAELLVERNVAGVGIDTLSIDPGNTTDFIAHKIILKADIYQVENLANLDALPATGATAIIGVLPVRDGSQAQARIFGLLNK